MKIRVFEQKDNLDRVSRVFYYEGNIISKSEEIRYYGNSHNPSRIIYKIRKGNRLVPYKEEEYYFTANNLVKLSFFILKNGKRTNTGMIKYYYKNSKQTRIEYYSLDKLLNKIIIFGLDQYDYSEGNLSTRRIIEYEVNPGTGKPMQIGHFYLRYKNGKIDSMKLSILDRKSKKIIEKIITNSELVDDKIDDIEKYYIRRSRGKDFLKQ
jgi:hypothetical protein